MKYGLIVTSKEAVSSDGVVLTRDGARYWVVDECGGWVDATSTSTEWDTGKVPDDLKTFRTREAAEKFGQRWKGHPWYVQPRDFEVIEVEARYVQKGWKIK